MFPPARPSNHGIRRRQAGANRDEFAQVYIYFAASAFFAFPSISSRSGPAGRASASFNALGKCCEAVFKGSRLFETSPLEHGAHLSIRGRRKRSRAFSSQIKAGILAQFRGSLLDSNRNVFVVSPLELKEQTCEYSF